MNLINQCLATEVIINNKAITFLNVYRSPSNLNELFIEKFESVMNIAKSKMCYVLGDMNYNLINLDKHEPTNNYYNILTSCSFKPLISKPTRITDSSTTLIDHIWTNDLRNTSIHNSHILITDITDHLSCLSIVASPYILLKGYRYVTRRQITEENSNKFIDKIIETQHLLSFHVTNTHQLTLEQKYDDYFFHLFKIYNDCFPICIKKIHVKTICKP